MNIISFIKILENQKKRQTEFMHKVAENIEAVIYVVLCLFHQIAPRINPQCLVKSHIYLIYMKALGWNEQNL